MNREGSKADTSPAAVLLSGEGMGSENSRTPAQLFEERNVNLYSQVSKAVFLAANAVRT